ncbi:MAG TPA: DUF192 domain-containing protein [Candidatus Udaeobacter sp.]|nr:DUF192 domain-containing protein [Candidatus Udaeobacter sp.]
MTQPKPFKFWHLIFLLVVFIFFIGNAIYSSWWKKAVVKIGGQEVRVLVADNYKHQVKGWSGRKDMGQYGGMLFIFADHGQHAMVMRDMQFPLDIVWLDGNKIIDFAPNLPAEAGIAEDKLTIYRSRAASTMVLELPAGFMEKNGLKIGDTIQVQG